MLDVGCFERLAFDVLHVADRAADALRGLEHGRRVHQRFELAGFRILDAFGQMLERTDWLSDRLPAEASAMMRSPGCVIDMQLAEGRDVVEAGIGARIGDHHEAVAHENSAAIGHGSIFRETTFDISIFEFVRRPVVATHIAKVCCIAIAIFSRHEKHH